MSREVSSVGKAFAALRAGEGFELLMDRRLVTLEGVAVIQHLPALAALQLRPATTLQEHLVRTQVPVPTWVPYLPYTVQLI